jgi:LysR family glycine cleavage system transcriptional activator
LFQGLALFVNELPCKAKESDRPYREDEMRRLPPLNAVKAFEAVVRLGNYNNAANELGVTHGAISRQVRLLEGYLGCRLFQTSGRHLVPTELARYYAAEVGGGLDRISLASARVIEPAAARLVRVSGMPSFVIHWMMPRLGGFQKSHPNIEVSLSASREPLEHLVSSNDVILRRQPMEWGGFECAHVFSDYRVMVCSPLVLRERKISTPKDILRETQLICDGKNQAGVWQRWMQAEGLEPPRQHRRLKFDHIFVLIEAVSRGLGVAIIPYSVVADLLDSGALVEPLSDMRMCYPNLYALYPETGRQPSSVKIFLNWLMQQGSAFSSRLLPQPPGTGFHPTEQFIPA